MYQVDVYLRVRRAVTVDGMSIREVSRVFGLPQLLRKHLDLGDAPGRANTGDKMMTLVASALAGDDCIDDADALRVGGTARVLGFTAKAPSTPRFREGRLWAPSCAATGVRRLSTSLWMGRESGSRPHRTHPKTMYEP